VQRAIPDWRGRRGEAATEGMLANAAGKVSPTSVPIFTCVCVCVKLSRFMLYIYIYT
jgi:hypothetical protein